MKKLLLVLLIGGGLGTLWVLTRPSERKTLISSTLDLWAERAKAIQKPFSRENANRLLESMEDGNIRLLREWTEVYLSHDEKKAKQLFPILETTLAPHFEGRKAELSQYKGIFFE